MRTTRNSQPDIGTLSFSEEKTQNKKKKNSYPWKNTYIKQRKEKKKEKRETDKRKNNEKRNICLILLIPR